MNMKRRNQRCKSPQQQRRRGKICTDQKEEEINSCIFRGRNFQGGI